MFHSLLLSTLFLSNSFAQEGEAVLKWTTSEKTSFIENCNSGRPNHISEKEMNGICSCTQSELEKRFKPSELTTPEAQTYSNKVIETCALGTKGAWSSMLKNQFLNGCSSNPKKGIDIVQLKEICSCSLKMLEVRFSPTELQTPASQEFSVNAAKTCQDQVLKK